MKKIIHILLFFVMSLVAQAQATGVKRVSVDSLGQVTKIAFGGFNSEKGTQEMWTSISEMKPHLFISLGDIISSDANAMSHLAGRYLKQLDKKFYRWFLERVPQLSVWNQHELGAYSSSGFSDDQLMKIRDAYLMFYDIKNEQMPSAKGVYYSKEIKQKEKSIKIYLLDVNSFRTKDEILGDEQWLWLRKEVEKSEASAHILVSGFPFFTEGKKEYSWKNNFPNSMQKLKDFINLFSDKSFVFMSGGMRGAMLAKYQLPDVKYPLYEINSSAMNVAGKARKKIKGKSVEESLFPGRNFGMMTIKWDDPMQLKVEIFDIQSFNVREIQIYLDDLH